MWVKLACHDKICLVLIFFITDYVTFVCVKKPPMTVERKQIVRSWLRPYIMQW